MIEHKIGEIFEHKNGYLKVIKIDGTEIGCDGDFYLKTPECLQCLPHERTDGKNVYYRFISKNEVRKLKLNRIQL